LTASGSGSITKILVPVDGSDNSFRAASVAIELASKYGAELQVIHVMTVNQNRRALGFYGPSDPEEISKIVESAKQEASPWFERIKKEAERLGVRLKSEVIEGPLSIVGDIVNYAEQNNVDLIVIGSRGRTGFKKLLLGSIASGVVTYSPCPVLVVK